MSKKKLEGLGHVTCLIVGDWSHDGHSMTEVVSVASNLTRDQLIEAYKAGVAAVGLDPQEEVACDYEENWVTIDQWRKLEASGMALKDVFGDKSCLEFKEAKRNVEIGEQFTLYPEDFVRMWMFVANKGNPDLRYEIRLDDPAVINIGGYGLLSN